MTKAQIIAKFHLYMDDTTELSSQEESDLFDKIYNKVMTDRPWEISKTQKTDTQSTSVPYVALPSDFAYLYPNNDQTGSDSFGERPVIFIGTTYSPCKVINWSDRRQYLYDTNAAYIDIANSRLVFTVQPTVANAIEYDYIAFPTALASADSPVFPSAYHDIIYHGMCTDEFVIEQSDKAKSYRQENQAMYDELMEGLAMWNAKLIQN